MDRVDLYVFAFILPNLVVNLLDNNIFFIIKWLEGYKFPPILIYNRSLSWHQPSFGHISAKTLSPRDHLFSNTLIMPTKLSNTLDSTLYGPKQNLTPKISSCCNTKLLTIIYVVRDTRSHSSSVFSFAFIPIDGLDRCSKPLTRSKVPMNIFHPKPQGSFEWNHSVCSHDLWVIDPIEPKALSGCTIVVVPCKLHWTSTIVTFLRVAWILWVDCVTITFRTTIYFFYITKVCKPAYVDIQN